MCLAASTVEAAVSSIQNPHSAPNQMALEFFPEVQVIPLLGVNNQARTLWLLIPFSSRTEVWASVLVPNMAPKDWSLIVNKSLLILDLRRRTMP